MLVADLHIGHSAAVRRP